MNRAMNRAMAHAMARTVHATHAARSLRVGQSGRRGRGEMVRTVVAMIALLVVMMTMMMASSSISADAASMAATCKHNCVHVIFSNHLDVGYNSYTPQDLSAQVLGLYFKTYFPRAIAIAQQMRLKTPDEYVWLTQPWLVSLYFNCPPRMSTYCPTDDEKADFALAIERGDVQFHGFPFNSEFEVHTTELFEAGLQLSAEVALEYKRVFGRPNFVSQRDVPGTTRSIIPILVRNGIKAMTIGANNFPVATPAPSAFVWRAPEDGSHVYMLYHPYGYGGWDVSDATIVDGFDQVLVTVWDGDNNGPRDNVTQVEQIYAQIRSEFVNYTVVASTYDEYIDRLDAAYKSGDIFLPVFEQEWGDTWIQGTGSDPVRSAHWRALQRLHADCTHDPTCDSESAAFRNFTRLLLKGGEHTWGGCFPCQITGAREGFLNSSYYKWSNADFATVRNTSDFRNAEATWIEQREWTSTFPLSALPDDHPIVARAAQWFAFAVPHQPDVSPAHGWVQVPLTNSGDADAQVQPPSLSPTLSPSTFNTTNQFAIGFSAAGAIAFLEHSPTGAQFADADHTLGGFAYQTHTEDEYTVFTAEYGSCTTTLNGTCPWALLDYSKYLVNKYAQPVAMRRVPSVTGLFVRYSNVPGEENLVSAFALNMTMDTEGARSPLHTYYGAPVTLWLEIEAIAAAQPSALGAFRLTLQWFDKSSTRLPESLWMEFDPLPQSARSSPGVDDDGVVFHVNKLGQFVDPANVFANGSAHLHGTAYGVELPGTMALSSWEAGLVCVGLFDDPVLGRHATPFPTPLAGAPNSVASGVAFNLFNNIWGTNYPMWYPYVEGDENTVVHVDMQLLNGAGGVAETVMKEKQTKKKKKQQQEKDDDGGEHDVVVSA